MGPFQGDLHETLHVSSHSISLLLRYQGIHGWDIVRPLWLKGTDCNSIWLSFSLVASWNSQYVPDIRSSLSCRYLQRTKLGPGTLACRVLLWGWVTIESHQTRFWTGSEDQLFIVKILKLSIPTCQESSLASHQCFKALFIQSGLCLTSP